MRGWYFWSVAVLLLGVGQAQPPSGSPRGAEPDAKSQSLFRPEVVNSKTKRIMLSFPGEGERWWWVETAGKPETVPARVSDKKTVVETTGAILWVLDGKTGNLARFDLAKTSDTIEFKSGTWTHVARLRVEAKAKGKPIAAAIVSVKDKGGKVQTRVLDPTAYGAAEFERVMLGTVKVEVHYDDLKSASQDVDLKAERQEVIPRVEMTISADVPTVEPPTAATGAPAGSTQQAGGKQGGIGSIIGTMISLLLGMVAVLGVLYLVLRYVAGHDQRVAEFMQKLGVQLPQPQTEPSDVGTVSSPQPAAQPVVPEGYCPFCGQKKDPVTGACACTLGTTGGVTSAVSRGQPRLVGMQGIYAGQVYELGTDVLTVGREVGNTLVLDEDSTVSRRHAQIIRQNGNFVVQDLGSSNGTYVNGIRISAETLLRPGDTVQFGASVFKFEV